MQSFVIGQLRVYTTNAHDGSVDSAQVAQEKLKLFHSEEYPVFEMNQVHGEHVEVIQEASTQTKMTATDGLITRRKKCYLMVKTADCVPLIMYDQAHQSVALLHVGWRGAHQGIIAKALAQMRVLYGTDPSTANYYIGPAIKSCCYRFTDAPVQADDPAWRQHVVRKDAIWQIDLPGFIRAACLAMGANQQHIIDSEECTGHQLDYHSYTRSKKTGKRTGLQATIVQLS